MSNDCGIVLAAYGQKYIEESLPLVNSIRTHMPSLSITLVTDLDTDVPDNCYDNVKRMDIESEFDSDESKKLKEAIGDSVSSCPKLLGFLFKVKALSHTPYKYSLFLDADTMIGHPINDMFHLLKKYDVLVGYAPTKTPSTVGSTPIDHLNKHAAIPRINTGVVAYSYNAIEKGFLQSWENLLISGIERGKHISRAKYGDQSEFRSLVWDSPANIFVLPGEYHFRAGNTTVLDGPIRILHGRPRGGRENLIEFLNSTHEKRIWMAPDGMRKSSDGFVSFHPYPYGADTIAA